MITSNPFQIPSCFQRAEQLRRAVRFKRMVTSIIVASTGGLAALLIIGCIDEQAKATANKAESSGRMELTENSRPQQPIAMEIKPAVSPTVETPSAVASADQPTKLANQAIDTFYVVKPGDTLWMIARQHGTTIKSLREANGLRSDRIATGLKLKLPSA